MNRVSLPLLIAALLLGGCAWDDAAVSGSTARVPPATDQPAIDQRSPSAPTNERAAAIALQQLGRPYRYGGASPAGFDCSGLVHYAYGRAGLPVPRTTGALWQALPPVAMADVRAGDVLFFDIDGKPSHVGIYVGEGQFVHAPATGRSVTLASVDQPFYRDAVLRVGRVRGPQRR
ncbi:MAG: C40 family peptidase [Pseudomonadota bacterium]